VADSPRSGGALSDENERWPGDIHLTLGAFDDPATLTTQFHKFAGETLPWLRLADGLTRHRTAPSAGEIIPG
jgi:hypothetical protein